MNNRVMSLPGTEEGVYMSLPPDRHRRLEDRLTGGGSALDSSVGFDSQPEPLNISQQLSTSLSQHPQRQSQMQQQAEAGAGAVPQKPWPNPPAKNVSPTKSRPSGGPKSKPTAVVSPEATEDVNMADKMSNGDDLSDHKEGSDKKRKRGGAEEQQKDGGSPFKTITKYFKQRDTDDTAAASKLHEKSKELAEKQKELSTMEEALQARVKEIEERENSLKKYESELQQLHQLQKQIKMFQEERELEREQSHLRETQRQNLAQNALIQLLSKLNEMERKEVRSRVHANCVRLGYVTMKRVGPTVSEFWEDGSAFRELEQKQREILLVRESIEKTRKSLLKKVRGQKPPEGEFQMPGDQMSTDEMINRDEVLKMRMQSLKREDNALVEKIDELEIEKRLHIKELMRIRDEDHSRFRNSPLLKERYFLLHLLGKGGFSEVYKAYDIQEFRYVAVKLHQLNPHWPEEKKMNYVKHATREYKIHQILKHPRIVRQFDVFKGEDDYFATVIEYCHGEDLDTYLKNQSVLGEREARSIIVQIVSGLVYLNEQPQPIIHYDLKPGNILFHDGEVKITDFGLSKIIEQDSSSSGIDLTSQGAGTYWYLPPECFQRGGTAKISSKVDVWSVGVMFYQMLYGKRPFGDEQSQETIWSERTILNATEVKFPEKPSVSAETKDFIRKCLTANQQHRPDVLTLGQIPYLKSTKKGK